MGFAILEQRAAQVEFTDNRHKFTERVSEIRLALRVSQTHLDRFFNDGDLPSMELTQVSFGGLSKIVDEFSHDHLETITPL
jgi:hypothetical protein